MASFGSPALAALGWLDLPEFAIHHNARAPSRPRALLRMDDRRVYFWIGRACMLDLNRKEAGIVIACINDDAGRRFAERLLPPAIVNTVLSYATNGYRLYVRGLVHRSVLVQLADAEGLGNAVRVLGAYWPVVVADLSGVSVFESSDVEDEP